MFFAYGIMFWLFTHVKYNSGISNVVCYQILQSCADEDVCLLLTPTIYLRYKFIDLRSEGKLPFFMNIVAFNILTNKHQPLKRNC